MLAEDNAWMVEAARRTTASDTRRSAWLDAAEQADDLAPSRGILIALVISAPLLALVVALVAAVL